MKITIVTPSYNSGRFLPATLDSVRQQAATGLEIDHIVVDGGSSDGSVALLEQHRASLRHLIVEPDRGPASAINKGLRLANGDIVAWLNADDCYQPGALQRVADAFQRHPRKALAFGRCRIVNEQGAEIRRGITRFKEAFFPFSCRFMVQTINYISQPAMFFRRDAMLAAGFLREDYKAAWDYDYILRLWRQGGAVRIPGPPLADFRWHPASISGGWYSRQFKEEWETAAADAGRWSPQSLLHLGVRWGIVGIYRLMEKRRERKSACG
ncbi:MAG: hypothetical protein A2498_06565 [Lentisphaerae bacterium RIFOXYC12_FULL_60_16]|nr:MAG: hypothetical protein A2498_06565 [Lentisphaerae bacterium RIFOXYC12_FULL_60_16]OGV73397.1 MAG: hypothetical protein A2269_04305 [Lentisphaerae bacterium RIFOXYA12_FULL_60_10]OGV77507.1 MAG: hypothetical protein A2340_15135 [Lentisphaerae bacterium RIFOXYB12_FULL_60_10]